MARVYGGSFFREGTEAGMAQGQKVERYVAAHSLRRAFGHDDDQDSLIGSEQRGVAVMERRPGCSVLEAGHKLAEMNSCA